MRRRILQTTYDVVSRDFKALWEGKRTSMYNGKGPSFSLTAIKFIIFWMSSCFSLSSIGKTSGFFVPAESQADSRKLVSYEVGGRNQDKDRDTRRAEISCFADLAA
jgi:hypothetical protein